MNYWIVAMAIIVAMIGLRQDFGNFCCKGT